MVEIERRFERREGITFARATVTNTRSTPQRVRLENRLDGPTWVPRRGAVIAPGWSGNRWEATVEPGRCRGVGFASPSEPNSSPAVTVLCPNDPVDELLELCAVTRASATRESTPTRALARLDEWSPPSDVCSSDG